MPWSPQRSLDLAKVLTGRRQRVGLNCAIALDELFAERR
jgi:hypothetical protein